MPLLDPLALVGTTVSEKYEIEGFPTVIVLDAEGKVLKKDVGYSGANAKDYVAELKKLKKK